MDTLASHDESTQKQTTPKQSKIEVEITHKVHLPVLESWHSSIVFYDRELIQFVALRNFSIDYFSQRVRTRVT